MVAFNDIKIQNFTNQPEAVKAIKKILISACVKYFGIWIDNVPDEVISASCSKILQRYQNLTVREIEHSFDRVFDTLEKKVTITVENLITPINDYFMAKSLIESESRKLLAEMSQEATAEQKNMQHEQDCIKTYNDALQSSEWKGNIFMCKFLAEKLKHHFSPDQKQSWWHDVLKIQIVTEDSGIYLSNLGRFIDKKEKDETIESYKARKKEVYTRLMAEKIVMEAVKLKIEL